MPKDNSVKLPLPHNEISSQGLHWWVVLLIFVLAFLPLPFGSNRPITSALFVFSAGILAIGAALTLIRHPNFFPPSPATKWLKITIPLYCLALLWAVFQASPYAPTAWQNPSWHEASKLLGEPVASAISINPSALPESLMRLLAYLMIFCVSYIAGKNSSQAKTLVHALSLIGFAYALYGLWGLAAGTNTILGFEKWAYRDMLTSTFVNKNSYATYSALGLECMLVVFWQAVKTRSTRDAINLRGLHKNISHTTHSPNNFIASKWLELIAPKGTMILAAIFTLLAAHVLTGSRAGLISTLIGIFAMLICLAINRKWLLWRQAALVIPATLMLSFLLSSGHSHVLTRMKTEQLEQDSAQRLTAYQLTLNAIEKRPYLGYGLGTFQTVMQNFRTPSLVAEFQHAHNDYLETITELGIPAAVLLFGSIGIIFVLCLKGALTRNKHESYPLLAVGATFSIGAHSLVDFGMQIPAIAATYACILGLGFSQCFSSRHSKSTNQDNTN